MTPDDERMWQEAALYRALRFKEIEPVFAVCQPDDFMPGPHLDLAHMAQRLVMDPDPMTSAMGEAVRTGNEAARQLLIRLASDGAAWIASGSFYARQVSELAAKRRLTATLARIQQMLPTVSGDDLWALRDRAVAEITGVSAPTETGEDDYFDLDYFLSLTDEDVPFTLPGILKRGERWLMVGQEGGGKSALVYQLLTGASYGIDTLDAEYRAHEPQSVLFLDVENSPHQIAWNVKTVARTLQEMAPDVRPQWKNMKRKIVDLTDPAQSLNVVRSIVRHNPDILYMGTAYKMAFDSDYRVMGRAIMSTIDRIRAEIGCTTIIEHHAGWGQQNDRSGWRPDGTSEWARWPDFARGMEVKMTPQGRRVMRLIVSSRMDRSDGRNWPLAFVQGTVFPWTPVYEQAEWEYKYASLFTGDQNRRER